MLPSILIDIESLGKNEEFIKLMKYINTSESAQMKGIGGICKMTDEENEGIHEYANGFDFHKDNENIWSVETPETIDSVGPILFSFDKKTVFNFWTDYPDKLTPEQIAIFKKENPYLAALKPMK